MPTSSNISSDSEHRRHREDRRVGQLPGVRAVDRRHHGAHLEPGGRIGAPPAGELGQRTVCQVPLVDERTGERARPAVEVLVRAPRRPVDVPVVQLQRQVARGVRQVPADDSAGGAAGRGDRGDVEELTAVVVDRTEQHQRYAIALGGEEFDDVLAAQRRLPRSRAQPDHRLVRVVTMPVRLAAHRVAVGREGAVLDHDRVPLGRGPVEADHHQMQVHRQRVHHDDLVWPPPDEPGGGLAQELVVAHPRVGRLDVALDAEARPVVELHAEPFPQRPRLQPERVAREIGRLVVAAGRVRRDVEPAAQRRQRVGAIHFDRAQLARSRGGHLVSPSLIVVPRNVSALPRRISDRVCSSSTLLPRTSRPAGRSPSG